LGGSTTAPPGLGADCAAPLPLGYCNAGVVLDVEEGVTGFSVGDRVVSNGPHAEVVCVPKNLCAHIPDGVSDDEVAFTVLVAVRLLLPWERGRIIGVA
jgi:NADPH:quinone reductase-like Zn-dependent oxidoreductase